MKRIVCFHLYNDYSGSPKVLSFILEELLKKNYNIELVSSGYGGFLDKLEKYSNLKFYRYKYRFSNNKIIEIIRYLSVQIYTFFLSFRYIFKSNTIFYINTLLPIGPALAGYIMKKHIIYHYHEDANTKGIFYRFLSFVMQLLADDIICVSKYQASFLKRKNNISIIYNVLPQKLIDSLRSAISIDSFEKKNILMLSSLKIYKGVIEFIELSKKLCNYNFSLIINDSKEHIDLFLKRYSIICPNNLKIYPKQSNVEIFYKEASIVLNLSNKNYFIETFGMTVLEAFTAGLPVIVPTVGGIAELVDEDVDGYKIDVQDCNLIAEKIIEILSTKELYKRLRENASKKAEQFNPSMMIKNIENLIIK